MDVDGSTDDELVDCEVAATVTAALVDDDGEEGKEQEEAGIDEVWFIEKDELEVVELAYGGVTVAVTAVLEFETETYWLVVAWLV